MGDFGIAKVLNCTQAGLNRLGFLGGCRFRGFGLWGF